MFLAVLCCALTRTGAVFHRQVLHGFSTDDLQRRMGGRAQQLPWCLHLTQMIEVQPQCGPQSLVRTRPPATASALLYTHLTHFHACRLSHTLSLSCQHRDGGYIQFQFKNDFESEISTIWALCGTPPAHCQTACAFARAQLAWCVRLQTSRKSLGRALPCLPATLAISAIRISHAHLA